MTFPLNTSIITLSLPSSTNEDERKYHISDYFVAHPQHVLGDWCERPSSRGKPELSVRWPFAGSVVEGVSSLLCDAAKELTRVQGHRTSSPSFGDAALGDAASPAYSTPSPNSPEQAARDLYTLAKNGLACSQDSSDRAALLRQAQAAYAAFKAKWGSLRGSLGKGGVLASTHLARSREAAFLAALETKSGEPSRLLSTPTITADSVTDRPQLSPSDALLVCLDERGHVDLDRIATLLTIPPPEARAALLSEKLAFLSPPGCPSRVNLPPGCDIVSSMEYLTGDVGSKLTIAKSAAESDPTYALNVEALTIALPDPLGPEDITIGLGAGWVPAEVYKDWLLSLFPGHKWGLSVEHLPSSAGWAIACTNPKLASDDGTLRTQRFSGLDLLRDAINAKMPVAWDEWKDEEGKTHRVKNEILTMEAQARVSELRARFEMWAWQGASPGSSESDAKRCALLCRIYNERFNGHVPRDFSGDHLTFRGLASTVGHDSEERAYIPKPRQLRGVAKVLAGGTRDRSAYLVYPPGFGKTDPAILSAVKLTQLGLARRTLIAVPKQVCAQWQARFLALFPGLADEVLCCDDPVYGIAGFEATKPEQNDTQRDIVVCIPAQLQTHVEAEEADVAKRIAAGEKGITYYWTVGKLPKVQPERIYFVWEGAVRAWHKVVSMESGRIVMAPEINNIPPIEMKAFRSWRYWSTTAIHGPPQSKEAATKSGYSPREAFLASMAAPGWRYLIVSHEMLREVPLSETTFKSLLDEELGELRECLRDAEEVGSKEGSKGARRSLRAREATLQDMQARHEAKWAILRDRDRAPVSWEDLGIDLLILDEAHFAKNLGVSSKLDNVAGMPNSESQRAYDTYTKIQSVFRAGGRICALSGTPLTNTLAEAFIWQRMLQPELLRKLNLQHFDAWAGVFAEPFPSVELSATGQYRTITRLKFKNCPELLSLLAEAWDFVRE